MKYDLVILENDPEGLKMALEAARNFLSVAVVHVDNKTQSSSPKWDSIRELSFDHEGDWSSLQESALQREEADRKEFARLADQLFIDRYFGEPSFVNANIIDVTLKSPGISDDADWDSLVAGEFRIEATSIVIATGSKPKTVSHIPANGKTILFRDDLGNLESLPKSVVLVTDQNDASLLRFLETRNITVTQIPDLDDILRVTDLDGQGVEIELIGGTRIVSESFLMDLGRVGNTESLNLNEVGISVDDRNQLWCNDDLSTWVPNIFGLGEAVGYSGILENEENRCDYERILETISQAEFTSN